MIPYNSAYGNYSTRSFADIWPTSSDFTTDLASTALGASIVSMGVTTAKQETIWALLFAKYGNSHIASSDETQFLYQIATTIFQYGPTWIKRLDVQDTIRNLSVSDLILGSQSINNHAYNPSTAPSTATLEELTTIDDQSTGKWKKSKMDAYSQLQAILEDDVTGKFLDKFKGLFIRITQPQVPLWYVTEENEDE